MPPRCRSCGAPHRTSVTQRGDEQAAAAALAAGGPALELGIGTGRIALPLAARGVAFHGVDASPAMVAQLRASQAATRSG